MSAKVTNNYVVGRCYVISVRIDSSNIGGKFIAAA